MAVEVFNRYEFKYLINDTIFKKLNKELNEYMELDEYNKNDELYQIHNIYLDTKDNNLIRTSLSKPIYKEKIRLRSYEGFENNEFVYLEIKKKFNGLVNKRRTLLKLEEALDFIETAKKPRLKDYMNKQVLNELEYIFERNVLQPKTYISYNRKAYFNKDGHDLRVTFDTQIITKRNNKKNQEKLLEDEMWIMEIKAEKSFPVWITKLLSKYEIYSTSFSKYGVEYQKMLLNTNQNKIIGINEKACQNIKTKGGFKLCSDF